MIDDLKKMRLKRQMVENYSDLLQEHAAAVGAFCVTHDIELEDGVELALEIMGEYGRILLETGVFDKQQKRWEIAKETLRRQQYEEK